MQAMLVLWQERITVEPEIGNGRDDEHVSPQTGELSHSLGQLI